MGQNSLTKSLKGVTYLKDGFKLPVKGNQNSEVMCDWYNKVYLEQRLYKTSSLSAPKRLQSLNICSEHISCFRRALDFGVRFNTQKKKSRFGSLRAIYLKAFSEKGGGVEK